MAQDGIQPLPWAVRRRMHRCCEGKAGNHRLNPSDTEQAAGGLRILPSKGERHISPAPQHRDAVALAQMVGQRFRFGQVKGDGSDMVGKGLRCVQKGLRHPIGAQADHGFFRRQLFPLQPEQGQTGGVFLPQHPCGDQRKTAVQAAVEHPADTASLQRQGAAAECAALFVGQLTAQKGDAVDAFFVEAGEMAAGGDDVGVVQKITPF